MVPAPSLAACLYISVWGRWMMDEGSASASQTLAPLIYPHIRPGGVGDYGKGRWLQGALSAERANIQYFFPAMCETRRDFLAPVGDIGLG